MDKTGPTVFDSENVIAKSVRTANDSADDRVQSRAITAASQNSDFLHECVSCPFHNKACAFWRSTRVRNAAAFALPKSEEILGEVRLASSIQHSERLFRSVEFLFQHICHSSLADIDLFVAARGPGSFTGLRVGTGGNGGFCGRTWETGRGSNDAGGAGLENRNSKVHSSHQPSMPGAEKSTGRFIGAAGETLIEERPAVVLKPAEWFASLPRQPLIFCGDGAIRYRAEIEADREWTVHPAWISTLASTIAELAATPNCGPLEPLYVRKTDAEIARESIVSPRFVRFGRAISTGSSTSSDRGITCLIGRSTAITVCLNDDSFTSSFVAEIDEAEWRRRLSVLSFSTSRRTSSEIYNIAVESGYARSGIGKQLMTAAIEESARTEGPQESFSKCVNPTIRPSISTWDSTSGSLASERTTTRIRLKMHTSWNTRFPIPVPDTPEKSSRLMHDRTTPSG